MPVGQPAAEDNTSRTEPVIVRLLIGLVGIYTALAIALRRLLWALAIEGVATIWLWALQAGRFAFDDPRMLAPEVAWFELKD